MESAVQLGQFSNVHFGKAAERQAEVSAAELPEVLARRELAPMEGATAKKDTAPQSD